MSFIICSAYNSPWTWTADLNSEQHPKKSPSKHGTTWKKPQEEPERKEHSCHVPHVLDQGEQISVRADLNELRQVHLFSWSDTDAFSVCRSFHLYL